MAQLNCELLRKIMFVETMHTQKEAKYIKMRKRKFYNNLKVLFGVLRPLYVYTCHSALTGDFTNFTKLLCLMFTAPVTINVPMTLPALFYTNLLIDRFCWGKVRDDWLNHNFTRPWHQMWGAHLSCKYETCVDATFCLVGKQNHMNCDVFKRVQTSMP